MKILLIRPPSNNFYQIVPSLGLGYLAAEALRAGNKVSLLDCVRDGVTEASFPSWFRKAGPFDLVGIQIFTNDFNSSKRILKALKENQPGVVTIAGGPHVTGMPVYTLANMPWCDHALMGECDVSFRKFLCALEGSGSLTDVPGLARRDGDGKIILNPQATHIALEDNHWPAWELMDPRTYPLAPHGAFARNFPTAPMIVSRGCPYPCIYCAASLTVGKALRYRHPSDVCDEMEFLRDKFGVREIHFVDDNFTYLPEKAAAVCDTILSRGIKLPWALPNGVKLERLDQGLVTLMEKAGCYSMAVGIESGSNRVLRTVGRGTLPEEMEEKIKMVKRSTNIRLTGFFVMGFPGEKLEDMKETIDFALRLPLDRAHFSNFLPLPGTDVFNELVGRGEIKPDTMDWDSYIDNGSCYSPADVGMPALRRMMKKGFLCFYARPRIALGMLSEIRSLAQLKVILARTFDTFR